MINPNNIIMLDTTEQKPMILKLDDVPEYDTEDYDLLDEKDFNRYLSDIERVVRTSFEYRKLIGFLRENMNMNTCAFMENVNNIESFKIKIHLHHHPFTLYDITRIVFNKRCAFREPVDVESVAKEVMYLHYIGVVGLIPLSETVHELVHNQYLYIPAQYVFGRYLDFVNMYEPYFTAEQLDNWNAILAYSNDFYKFVENNNAILETRHVYVDDSSIHQHSATVEEMLGFMSNRIDEIKLGTDVGFKVERVLIDPIERVR